MKSIWFWVFDSSTDTWQFHASDYDPEVSIQVRRVSPTEAITARHRATTMPIEVLDQVLGMLKSIDLWGQAERGVTRIEMDGEEVKRAAVNTKRLADLLAARQIVKDMKTFQE